MLGYFDHSAHALHLLRYTSIAHDKRHGGRRSFGRKTVDAKNNIKTFLLNNNTENPTGAFCAQIGYTLDYFRRRFKYKTNTFGA